MFKDGDAGARLDKKLASTRKERAQKLRAGGPLPSSCRH